MDTPMLIVWCVGQAVVVGLYVWTSAANRNLPHGGSACDCCPGNRQGR